MNALIKISHSRTLMTASVHSGEVPSTRLPPYPFGLHKLRPIQIRLMNQRAKYKEDDNATGGKAWLPAENGTANEYLPMSTKLLTPVAINFPIVQSFKLFLHSSQLSENVEQTILPLQRDCLRIPNPCHPHSHPRSIIKSYAVVINSIDNLMRSLDFRVPFLLLRDGIQHPRS